MMQPERTKVTDAVSSHAASGELVDLDGERYYVIRNVDAMPPFFMSVISSADHWLFVSSSGGLTAGRISPQTALFPYLPVDRIHDSSLHTGCRTLLRVGQPGGQQVLWEPFNREHDGRFRVTRNLYKSTLGDKLRFEELNHDLGLAFHYTWATSPQYGFVRRCELRNLASTPQPIELLDGLQNILPAGTPEAVQANASNLVNAYKWTELDPGSGLAMFALYSGISDRPEPCESLRANVVYCLGLDAPAVLLSSLQLDRFRHGEPLAREVRKRGIRGAYFACTRLLLPAGATQRWQIVADIEQTQGRIGDLIRRLDDPAGAARAIEQSVEAGSDELARIVGAADGFQLADEETVTAHHCANVLFNVLRGGIFDDQYRVSTVDFARHVAYFNSRAHERHREWLGGLPATTTLEQLRASVLQCGDPQLERLCYEYLPITFGRRHGDPSRPWNRFTIRLKDDNGDRVLSFEGNWRDIFQNWEALALSFPEFIEYFVAKFVNATTVDGYNPYRITRQGIDWEVEEPDNPWSHIGYWGDHQVIYLLKLLELSRQFHPDRLSALLHQPVFSYANVPYRIGNFAALVENPKQTVKYEHALAARIAERVAATGADGKLHVDGTGAVYLASLLEKLLVPLLAKLGNFVVDGGIWLNTQRPEWNDANNALVGHGVSMVTVYYLRRYLRFLRDLLAEERESVELSTEVADWLVETATAFARMRPSLGAGPISADLRWNLLEQVGTAASRYRAAVYRDLPFSGKTRLPLAQVTALLDDALAAIDHTIGSNRRADGTYNAYNLLDLRPGAVSVDGLYLMLEGQVAALSSGAIAPDAAAALVETLFESDIHRADQRSFMLYPDRALPGFLDKNRIPAGRVASIPLLQRMLQANDERVVASDGAGGHRFNADFRNVGDLDARLDALVGRYGHDVEASREPLRALYEDVFRHREFTGRSGGMFGFEGLGCIYWHMVSKLLLSIQENFFAALDQRADDATCRRLGSLYYRVRDGLGFNKTPAEYGAFPTDPYSHTPGHGGARQPGMTGQVKEEVLTRFGELGLRIAGGSVHVDPRLLRAREFVAAARRFRFVDVHGQWQEITVPASGLAFTWCQVPIVYRLRATDRPSLTATLQDGSTRVLTQLSLPHELSSELFLRSGRVRQISVEFAPEALLGD
jgi:hypothetical protein